MSLIEDLCENNSGGDAMRCRMFRYPEQPFPLPIELRSAGYHYVTSPDYSWDGRRRPDKPALVQYTISGRGGLELDGVRFEVPPEHAMLLTFPENHRYFLPPDSRHWEVVYVNFGGSDARRLLLELRRRFGAVVRLRSNSDPVRRIHTLLENPPPTTAWESGTAGFRLFMELAREAERHDDAKPRPEFIDRVLDYCRANMGMGLEVKKLASLSGYSRWHFSREFKRVLGVSVPQYVTELRLEQALELLQTTRLSVKEIAERCGFDNVSYFIKLFSGRFHSTPGELRR